MSDYTIRRATLGDADFLVETVIQAEKSSTGTCGLANFYGLAESNLRQVLRAMFEEEIPGCEFSIDSFFVAEENDSGKLLGALSGWIESISGGGGSSFIKANLLGFCMPPEALNYSKNMGAIVKDLVFAREPGSYQMEYSYVIPDARGSGVMLALLEAHMRECIEKCPAETPMYMKAYKSNRVSVGFYELIGFEPVETKCGDDRCL